MVKMLLLRAFTGRALIEAGLAALEASRSTNLPAHGPHALMNIGAVNSAPVDNDAHKYGQDKFNIGETAQRKVVENIHKE